MRRFLEILEAAALSAAIVALIGLIGIEGSVRARLPSILASAHSAAERFASASDSLSDAARKQDSYLDHTSRELTKTVADAHDLLIHTDMALNGKNGRGGLLPMASELVAEQQFQMDVAEAKVDRALDDLDAAEKQAQPILASINAAAVGAANASNSLARTAADPHIAESLERLDRAMAEADATLANLQAISGSGNRDAAMIETRLRQALKPASLLKALLMRALNAAGPALQLASGIR